MPIYMYRCDTCGEQEHMFKMSDVQPFVICDCGKKARRVYTPIADIWHCDGAHKTDYTNDGGIGTKREQLNKEWSRMTGEPPPPPAADVPRNSKDKY